MPNIKFDWTFNLGHIISVLGLASIMVTGWVNLNNKVSILEVRQILMQESIAEAKVTSEKNKDFLSNEIRDLRNLVTKPR